MPKDKRRLERAKLRLMREEILANLAEAESLMARKRWAEACEMLEKLDRRYPDLVEVLYDLAETYHEIHDHQNYLLTCERLAKLTPDDPDMIVNLGGAYLMNLRPVSALRTFQEFLKRWPEHARAGKIQTEVVELQAHMDEMFPKLGISGEEAFAVGALHEELQSWLAQGDYAQAHKVAEKLLRLRPDFPPGLNNLSQIYFLEGQLDQAITTAQRVLVTHPDNYHALSNLTRYLYLSGRIDEAAQYAERLKGVQSEAVDIWVKKAEALSYLGDDPGVLDAFTGAEQAGVLEPPVGDPLLYHLAAVATLRLGDEAKARKLWRQALKYQPGFGFAQDNLADLRKPLAERHAPWAFSFVMWVTPAAHRDLQELAHKKGSEGAINRAFERFFRKHSEIMKVIPALLDRGDPLGRDFAYHTAHQLQTPELLAALRDFALGQRGPDELRLKAATTASHAGLIPQGMVRLWRAGEWQDLLIIEQELSGEPGRNHLPQVEEWLGEAIAALNQDDPEKAEHLLKQALEVEPDAPDLMNNLAMTLERLGRQSEAIALTRTILARHPEYVFARTALAQVHIGNGELEQAKALLEPLWSHKRLHFSEYAAFCNAEIRLLLAEGQIESARNLLATWEQAMPDHPATSYWRKQVEQARPR